MKDERNQESEGDASERKDTREQGQEKPLVPGPSTQPCLAPKRVPYPAGQPAGEKTKRQAAERPLSKHEKETKTRNGDATRASAAPSAATRRAADQGRERDQPQGGRRETRIVAMRSTVAVTANEAPSRRTRSTWAGGRTLLWTTTLDSTASATPGQ